MKKIPKIKTSKASLPANNIKTLCIDDAQLVFSFKYFHGESISIEDFNNFHQDCLVAIASLKDFHESIANLSKLTVKEAFDVRTKKQLHLHPIENKAANRVSYILREGYGFPERLVDEFENQYYEFASNNGQRVIAIRHDFVIEPLFLDPNHLVYNNSSKNRQNKLMYKTPSIFSPDAEEKLLDELTK